MSLTTAQETTLAAHIRANQDAAVVAALAIRNDVELARLYNAPASPAFYVWKPSVTQDEIMQNGFDWVRVDNLSVGKARIWEWLFQNEGRAIDPRKPSVIAGIAECWKGTAADLAVRAAVFLHCYRPASVFERLFATGTGTAADANGVGPGMAGAQAALSHEDISLALNHNPV